MSRSWGLRAVFGQNQPENGPNPGLKKNESLNNFAKNEYFFLKIGPVVHLSDTERVAILDF